MASASVSTTVSPSKVLTGVSSASDREINRSESGTDKPCSHFEIVCRTTFSFTASSCWESPFDLPPRRQGALALLPARGDGEGLEEQVHTLQYIRGECGGFGRILLVDCGLTEEGRKLCGLLAGEDRWVSVCAPEAVETYLS